MPAYIMRLDDIAPNMHWKNYRRVKQLFDDYEVKPLIGVIPDNQDPALLRFPAVSEEEFWQEIKEVRQSGWHVAQHGYRHEYVNRCAGLLGTSDGSEFAQLSYAEQLAKISRGRAILKQHGISVDTFMAPSHSFDATTLVALRDAGFRYVTDGFALYPYAQDGLVFVPQLTATPRPMPCGMHTFCLHLNGFGERDHRKLQNFVQRHHRQVITFADGLANAPKLPLNRVVGNLLGTSLWTVRRVQSAIRGRRAA